jgi:cytochrome P450 family 9
VNRENIQTVDADKLLSKSILCSHDQKWKDMRTLLSPIFTSSKMKNMFKLLTECVEELMTIYEGKLKANGNELEVDIHDVFARITADGIATTILGLKSDCVKNKDSEIFKIAETLEEDFTNPTTFSLLLIFPKLFKLFGLKMFRQSAQDFFFVNITGEIERRRAGKIKKPDVIQLLVAAKEDQMKLENNSESKDKRASKWSDEDLVAQAATMFFAGFGTAASLMQALSFELSRNPEVQQTLIDEVDEMLETLDGKTISYEELNGMKFLEMVIHET